MFAGMGSNHMGMGGLVPASIGAGAFAHGVGDGTSAGGMRGGGDASFRRAGRNDTSLQVCNDFTKGKCKRAKCNYAHPADGVRVQDGVVQICMDHAVSKCNRANCKFYHPPAKQT
mmetsp:Transcript_7873/g.14960  ORF Transcript_7873/g.14960 Transcript_7873/m.14960 type:complete len:115 (+) Transcript_7873:1398-1742(+)